MRNILNQPLYSLLFLLAGLGLVACTSALIDDTNSENNQGSSLETVPAVIDDQPADQIESVDNATPATGDNKIDQPTVIPSPTPFHLSGSVTDGQIGTPLPSEIYLIREGKALEDRASITTDDSGHFLLEDLEPPLTIRVETPGYELWETSLDTTENLAEFSELAITLTPQVTIGRVSAAGTDKPLTGVIITVDDAKAQSVISDDSGVFELYGLLPNDLISVEVPPTGYLPAEIIFAGDNGDLSLVLQPRSVTVIVRDKFTGAPIVGGEVSFDDMVEGITNTQGEAKLPLLPEVGQISVTGPGYLSTTVEYADDKAMEVALVPAGLQGIIRGGDTGEPLPLTTIYLGDIAVRTDENGRFILETLPITPTQVMIKMAGYHRTYAQISQTGVITGYEPPFAGGEGRWLTATACPETPQSNDNDLPCMDITVEAFQAKAIYVPLHYLRSRELMLGYLDFIAATELNAIVVDVKGDFGFLAWDSNVDLVAQVGADEWFSDTWLPLDEFVAEAKARNIYTIARIVVFKDNPLSHGKPELAVVKEDGTVWIDREELGWANPFREEVWNYNIELAKEVAAFGFDELNFDYIRFPSDGDVGAIVYEEENSLETRTTAIRQFMTSLSESLRPYGSFISADVFGLTIWVVPTSDMRIGQRIIDVAPLIDYLAPMVYPSTFGPGNLGYANPSAEPYNVVYRSQLEAETLVPPYVKVRPWLQGYWYSLEEMKQLKQAATDSNATGWTWWNAGGKYDNELFGPAEEAR